MKKISKDIIYWTGWLILVIFWNYGYPDALPFSDVLIAVVLSIIFLKKKK